jgi:hypothetical protein
MAITGQLSFNGREVVQIRTKWGDLEMDSLPDGLTREDLAALDLGDEVFCLVRYKLEDIGHGEKLDRQGIGTKPLTRKLGFKTLSVGFTVEGITKRADLEAKFLKEHASA